MKKNNTHIETTIDCDSKERSAILIALLFNEGFNGFEELPGKLKAYIPLESYNKDRFKKIITHLNISQFEYKEIEEENWNQNWEQSFEPICVNNFVSIRANFHEPIQGVEHEIIITPKMSFGTGHHATTYLMIELMKDLNFNNKTVLDFGTGTGVLAILAEKLGAINITAVDNDKWSIENTHENIMANHCLKINVFEADKIDETYRADIILANINLNILKENLSAIKVCAGRKATILFSGLLHSDKIPFEQNLEEVGFKIVKSKQRNGWIAIEAQYLEIDPKTSL